MSNTIKILGQNADGVIYVENESGVVFGIVGALTITDEDGLAFDEDAISVIENGFDCDLEQNWEEETTTIQTDCQGQIVFCNGSVKLVG